MTCAEARIRLQEVRDGGREPSGGSDSELARHIAACAGCSAFAAFLGAFGAEARDALDAAAAGMPHPDYAAIIARSSEERDREALRARRFRRSFATAAAGIAAGICVAVGVRAWLGRAERMQVALRVNVFVEQLFATPLLADADERIGDGPAGLRDWLQGEEAPFLP